MYQGDTEVLITQDINAHVWEEIILWFHQMLPFYLIIAFYQILDVKLLAVLRTWAFDSTTPRLSLLDVNINFFKLLAWHQATYSSYFTSGFLNDNYIRIPCLPNSGTWPCFNEVVKFVPGMICCLCMHICLAEFENFFHVFHFRLTLSAVALIL